MQAGGRANLFLRCRDAQGLGDRVRPRWIIVIAANTCNIPYLLSPSSDDASLLLRSVGILAAFLAFPLFAGTTQRSSFRLSRMQMAFVHSRRSSYQGHISFITFGACNHMVYAGFSQFLTSKSKSYEASWKLEIMFTHSTKDKT